MLRAGTFGMRGLLKLPGLRSLDFNELSLREQTRFNGVQTRRIGFLCETDRFSCVYDREDLFPVRMVVFEDMMVPVARHAEKLLSLYGDFMTPPPLDQRREHYPDILDFGEYAEA